MAENPKSKNIRYRPNAKAKPAAMKEFAEVNGFL
jgi:hypothetical protein